MTSVFGRFAPFVKSAFKYLTGISLNRKLLNILFILEIPVCNHKITGCRQMKLVYSQREKIFGLIKGVSWKKDYGGTGLNKNVELLAHAPACGVKPLWLTLCFSLSS